MKKGIERGMKNAIKRFGKKEMRKRAQALIFCLENHPENDEAWLETYKEVCREQLGGTW